jgi:hypothetical protein
MIYVISDLTDPFTSYVKDDPVRPHIPLNQRINDTAKIFALIENDQVSAMVCGKFCEGVPSNESQLMREVTNPDTIVFYTIWSYSPGAGARLIREGLEQVKINFPNIKRFVTLSPQTKMAERFHLRNGATVFRINSGSVNYEYQ